MSAPAENSPAPQLPTRAELAGAVREVLSRGGSRNPDVLLAEHAGRTFVVKDFAPRAAWVRASIGRWITRREARAWRALAGHPSVPRFFGLIDALALAVEYRPGRSLDTGVALGPHFIPDLARALSEMHARGVVHLDLRHRDNVMCDDQTGAPVLIDFGAALVFRPGGLAARWLLPLFAKIDYSGLNKYRARFPESQIERA